jgi:hypothetical protein
MNAKFEEKVAGIMSNKGCQPIEIATSARRGKKSVAVATFDENSVMMFTISATTGVRSK